MNARKLVFVITSIALVGVSILTAPQAAFAALTGGSPTTSVATAQIHRLNSVSELQAALNSSSDRLYIVGNPVDVQEYLKAIQRSPNLVLVVVESTGNHAADAEIAIKALQNSDLIRVQLIDQFTGTPNGLAAVRWDKTEDGKGRMDFHTAPRLRAVNYGNDAAVQEYGQIRKGGVSVPAALTEIAKRINAAVATDNSAKVTAAQSTIDNTRKAIEELTATIKQTQFTPQGYSTNLQTTWTNRLNQAQAALGNGSTLAQTSQATSIANTVAQEIGRYQAAINQEIGGRLLRERLTGGFLTIGLILLLLSAAYTSQIRRKASAEVAAKKEDLDKALSDVMALLEQSTYVATGASGKQKREAERLAALNDKLLEQTVGLQKFLEAAAKVLDANGLAWLQHHLLPFGSQYVLKVATGATTLTVTREEIQRLLSSSGKLNASYQFNVIGSSEDRQLSIVTLSDAINANFHEANSLYARLEQADTQLESRIVAMETEAQALRVAAEAQSQLSTDGTVAGLFTGEPVLETIVLAIEHPQTGHIAMAKEAKRNNDAIGGTEDHIEPAARMLVDGMKALAVAAYGTTTVVPVVQSAVDQLAAPESGINPRWVVALATKGSDSLATTIRRAPNESVANALTLVEKDLAGIVGTISDAVRINSLRQGSWPETLGVKNARIAQAQATILAGLRALGFFTSGDPEQLLREPNATPKGEAEAIHAWISDVVNPLHGGDIEQIRTIESQVDDAFAAIDSLVEAAERRTAGYKAASAKLSGDITDALDHQGNLNDAVRSGSNQYSLLSQKRACHDVLGKQQELSVLFQQATADTRNAQSERDQAYTSMDSGFVLTAGTCLDKGQQQIDSANGIVTKLPAALDKLVAKVTESETELERVTQAYNAVAQNVNQTGVRNATKSALLAVNNTLDSVANSYHTAPYEALSSLSESAVTLQAIDDAITTDLRLVAEIATALSSAQGLEYAATSAIQSASRESFTYATVQLGSARGTLGNYRSSLTAATSALAREDYEDALAYAQQAYTSVASVPELAQSAVSSAESAHNAEVSRLAAVEAQRIADAQAAEAQRIADAQAASYASTVDTSSPADYGSISD